MTETIYKEMILDLYRNPLNKKRLDSFDMRATGANPLCGDEIRIEMKLNKDGQVADIGFSGDGCAISQAAASLVTEHVKNKPQEALRNITEEDVLKMLGIPISYTRKKCALLAIKTIQSAYES